MSPSPDHESIKSRIGRLVEVWCLERGVEFSTYGSWTIGSKVAQRGAEPDECYVFGQVAAPERPDLAIEVIWTAGGIDKLEVYRGLGVGEVWMWRDGVIEIHVLGGDQYERRERSSVFPDLDLAELASFIEPEDQTGAVRRYRDL